MQGIIIRKAQIEDLENLLPLFELYRKFYGMSEDFTASENFLKERLENKDSEIFIALLTLEIIGFVQLYPLFSSTRLKPLWLLNDLYVKKEYRGSGISKLLMNESKLFAGSTGACGILLETQKSNTIGNRLYLSQGFKKDIDHNYYFLEV